MRSNMYMEGSDQYRYHMRKFGHPSQFGWKDVVHYGKLRSLTQKA